MKPLRIKNLVLGRGIPKICIPMTGKNEEELLKELAYIREFTPDLVEWRVDCLKDQESMWEMLKTISDNLGEIPLLFTFRTAGEGGCREIMYEDYVNLLKRAADSGYADLIDAELFFCPEGAEELVSVLKEREATVLASNHHFDRTPPTEEMVQRLIQMHKWGADVLKLAVMPQNREDVLRLMTAALRSEEDTQKPVVSMSMGETGMVSRVLGEDFSSCITFAAGLSASAPGQIPAESLRRFLQAIHELKTEKIDIKQVT